MAQAAESRGESAARAPFRRAQYERVEGREGLCREDLHTGQVFGLVKLEMVAEALKHCRETSR